MKDKTLSSYFLIVLIIAAAVACLWLFRPFLIEIVIAAVLASVFYSPFLKISKILRGRRKIAAILMCLFLLFIVILPVTNLIVFFSKRANVAYIETVSFVNNSSADFQEGFLSRFDFIDFESERAKEVIFEMTKNITEFISTGASMIIKGATSFIVSLILILLATFFFFIDGAKILQKLKFWSPLPNKYDVEIFQKFREISYMAMISTFVTALAQGIVGVIGFIIIGMPAFYPGLLIGFFSLIPYIGAMLIYVPIGIYLILVDQVAQGIFILVWGAVVIGNTDNIIRAWILHGKSKINPIFIIFSLLGGMALFGFWGLVLGPLILSLVTTIFHIYELEFDKSLEK